MIDRRHLLLAVFALAGGAMTVRADLRDAVGFTQNLGERLPADLVLRESDGQPTTLPQALDGRPGLLVFGYYTCPQLCGVTAEGVISVLRRIEPSVGPDYAFVHLSIDPEDTPVVARIERNTAVRRYGRGESNAGWHYLTADARTIAAFTKAAGFRYRPAPEIRGFAHPSGFMVVAPDGTLSRYFLGIDFSAAEVAAALRSAEQGGIGRRVADFLVACLHGGGIDGQVSWPWRAIQFGVGGGLLLLALGLVRLIRRPSAKGGAT